jgi:DNA-binding IclR family transcriptional regulator
MLSWYTEHNRHYPKTGRQLLSAVASLGNARPREIAAHLGWPQNRTRAWLSKYTGQGLLSCDSGRYRILAKGRRTLQFRLDNDPEKVG